MTSLLPQKLKNIYHLSKAILANLVFGFPSRKIKVIGVTGTNGKTTVVQMLAKIFEKAGFKVAFFSTINFKIEDKEWVNKTKFTTLSAFEVQKFIYQAVQNKCDYVILETSSHALDQHRVWGVQYDSAVITNVTREHLDYHKTMEEYRQAKKKLFELLEQSIKQKIIKGQPVKVKKTIAVNFDMEKPGDFVKFKVDKIYAYTIESRRIEEKIIKYHKNIELVEATDIELEVKSSHFHVGQNCLEIKLPGSFNIENALAAICIAQSEYIGMSIIQAALEKIKCIPGRLEYVENDKGIDILIDYAVTPDSLEKLYKWITRFQKDNESRIIVVFGACGDRDRGKRPIMGKIVSRYADVIIITNEDPYTEDPAQIIKEVANGVDNKNDKEDFFRISDRREAIQKALRLANPGDMIVVTGKGAEETMAIGKKRIPWNDRKVIEEELGKL